MAYTTTANVKTYASITGSGDDTLLGTLVAQAQQLIDSYTGRTFEASANTTRYFDAVQDVDRRMLYFDVDLCAINSVTNGDGTTVTSSQYTTLPRNETPYYAIKLLASASVSWTYDDDPEGALAVSGKWAYSETAPADIVHCANRLTHWLYNQRKEGADLDRALLVGNATVLPTRLPADVIQMLQPYRRIV